MSITSLIKTSPMTIFVINFYYYIVFFTFIPDIYAGSPDEWRGRQIYQLVTDRFALSDGSTTKACNPSDQIFCGGTFQGIIKKLDYIQGMGFNAIWISPVVKNINNTGSTLGEAYHGFWSQDITQIDPHFGTPDDLRALADALHEKDMYLMVDVVANNYAYPGPGPQTVYSDFVPFNEQKYFHPFCYISNYSNYTDAQECWLGDDSMSLPDLYSELPVVQQTWNQWGAEMVANYSIDGLRIDAAKHVDKPFWTSFQSAVNVYTLGEVLEGDSAIACQFMSAALSGVLNYPMWWPLTSIFSNSTTSMQYLRGNYEYVAAHCQDSTLLGTFTENQDQPRMASFTSDLAQQKNALAFALLSDGIPIVYYGAEQGFSGKQDPDNREALWLTNYNTSTPLYQMIGAINAARNTISQMADFTYWSPYWTYKTKIVFSNDEILALRKGYDHSILTMVTNQGSTAGQMGPYQIGDTNFIQGDEVMDVLSCATTIVGAWGVVTITMPPGGDPMVWIPIKWMMNTTICPDVVKTFKPPKSTPTPVISSQAAVPRSSASSSYLFVFFFMTLMWAALT